MSEEVTKYTVSKLLNFYYCGLCNVDFAVSKESDKGESSCPKCESGEEVISYNPIECKRCRNEEIGPKDNYCKICGLKLERA